MQWHMFFIQNECYTSGLTCEQVWGVTALYRCCVRLLLGAPLGLPCRAGTCHAMSRRLEKCHHEWLPTGIWSLRTHNSKVFWMDLMSCTTLTNCIHYISSQWKSERIANMYFEAVVEYGRTVLNWLTIMTSGGILW